MANYKVPPFRMPMPAHRCAQCEKKIEMGQDTWAFEHHVFDSVDCVDTWIEIGSLL